MDILHREFVYLWYYFDIQLRQIFWYWVIGIVIGSCVSVFLKDQIHRIAAYFGERCPGLVGIVIASALGIASPLCMYGTIPICAAFSRKGIKDDFLAAFMMSSILLNPQLIIYSTALGVGLLWVRILSSFVCGIAAGLLVRVFYCKNSPKTEVRENASNRHSERSEESPTCCRCFADAQHDEDLHTHNLGFFNFSAFDDPHNHDTHPNIVIRLLLNILRNIKATGLWFLVGIVLSAVFQRYVPAESIAKMFGKEHEGFALLMAATIGVPLYVCGGGTIPLILQWLADGMSAGSVAAFMITGPATKITNLGALKIALGVKHFILYLLFVMTFAVLSGFVVNIIL